MNVNPQHLPLHVAIQEAQTALNAALALVKDVNATARTELGNADNAAMSAVTDLGQGADTTLTDVEASLDSMVSELAVLAHVVQPKP